MARTFVRASSDYGENTAAVLTSAPLTLACWAYFAERTTVQTLMCLGVNTANANFLALDMAGTVANDPIRALTGSATGNGVAGSVNGPGADNTWGHCAAVFASATSRTAYFNGTAGTANTTSRTPSGINRTELGRLLFESGSITNYMNGRLAEAGIWNVALSAADILQLSKGVSPRLVRPEALVAYWPLVGRASPEPDLRGGFDLTLTGTSQADHPRVYCPGRRRTVFAPGVGGNTDYTASLSGSVTPSGAIAKAVAQPRTGTLTHTGSLTRASAQSRTGSLTTSGAVTKASAKPLAGTATTGGSLTRATSQSRTGSVTLTGLLTRATTKGLTGSLALAGSLTKAIARALAGSVTLSGAFVAGSLFTKALTGAVTLTGAAVVKATAKTVTGTVTASGSVLRAIAKAFTGLLTLTGVFSKSGGSGGLADLPPGGVIRRADTRRVIRPVTPPGRVVRRADTRRTFPD